MVNFIASSSGPSTAIRAPLVSCGGEVGPGIASGGEILARTLIFIRAGMLITIASIARP